MPGKRFVVFSTILALGWGLIKIPITKRQKKEFAHKQFFLDGSDSDNDVPLVNFGDLEFIGPVSVGTPAVTYTVQLDTGSSNLWLASSKCQSKGCTNKQKYDPSKSSTSKDMGEKIQIAYGDGSNAHGEVYEDTVTFGGFEVKNAGLGAMSYLSSSFESSDDDGLLGLAFNSISEDNIPTIFDDIYKAGIISDPIYSFFFTKDPSAAGSELVVGGFDSSKNSTAYKFYDVAQATYWNITLGDVSLGKDVISSGPVSGIVDTGTTCLAGPNHVVKKILKNIPQNPDCSNVSQYPSIFITIGNDQYEITPDYYLAEIDGSCQVLVQANEGFWILGDVFLRRFVSIFDYGKQQVGFALANQSGDSKALKQ